MDTLMDKLAQKLNAQEMIRANGEAEAEQMNYLKAQVGEYQGCLDRLMQVCNELGNLETRLGSLSLPQNSASDEAVAEIKSQIETLAQSTDSQLRELQNTTNSSLKDFSDNTNRILDQMSEQTGRKLDLISEQNDRRFEEMSEQTGKRLDLLSEQNDRRFEEMSEQTGKRLDLLSEQNDRRFEEMSEQTGKMLDEISEQTGKNLKSFTEQTDKQFKDLQGELLEKVSSEETLHKEGVKIYKNIQASMVNELEPLDENLQDMKKEILTQLKGIKIMTIVAVALSAFSLIAQLIKILGII